VVNALVCYLHRRVVYRFFFGFPSQALRAVRLAHPSVEFFTWMQHACAVEASVYMLTYDVTCVTSPRSRAAGFAHPEISGCARPKWRKAAFDVSSPPFTPLSSYMLPNRIRGVCVTSSKYDVGILDFGCAVPNSPQDSGRIKYIQIEMC